MSHGHEPPGYPPSTGVPPPLDRLGKPGDPSTSGRLGSLLLTGRSPRTRVRTHAACTRECHGHEPPPPPGSPPHRTVWRPRDPAIRQTPAASAPYFDVQPGLSALRRSASPRSRTHTRGVTRHHPAAPSRARTPREPPRGLSRHRARRGICACALRQRGGLLVRLLLLGSARLRCPSQFRTSTTRHPPAAPSRAKTPREPPRGLP